MKLSTIRSISVDIICLLATLVSLAGLAATTIYIFHDWNDYCFRTFYAVHDYNIAYIISSFLFLLYWIFFFILRKKKHTNSKLTKSVIKNYRIIGAILSAATFAIAGINYAIEKEHIKKYSLDCQLTSPDKAKQIEAIDSLYSIYRDNPSLYNEGVDSYKHIIKHAREGNPRAQNWVGVYYHYSALRKIDDARRYYGEDFIPPEAAAELDRATYWFMLAAKAGNHSGQSNLGMMYGNFIVSNLAYDREESEKWLLKAAQNNYPQAYLYLGRLYESSDLAKHSPIGRKARRKATKTA